MIDITTGFWLAIAVALVLFAIQALVCSLPFAAAALFVLACGWIRYTP